MKNNRGISKLINKNIHAIGNVRLAVEYFKHVILPLKPNSILDIGCGDGVLVDHILDTIQYRGVDIGAGCYPESSNARIDYIYDKRGLLKELEHAKADIVLLINVLEHTEEFSELFEIALNCSNKYVFVCLPNEENIHNIVKFVSGCGIDSHGLDMHGKHLNQRHLWLIQEYKARKILEKIGNVKNFHLISNHYSISFPNTLYKRLIYRFLMAFIPWKFKSRSFAYLFVKD